MRCRHLARRATRCLALAAALAAGAALPAAASVVPATADLETGTTGGFTQINQSTGSFAFAADDFYLGARGALAKYSGGGANGYARGLFNVDWRAGDDVWYRAAYYLPTGFKAAMQGQVALMRWDNWVSHPQDTDHGGIVIYGSDKRARLAKERLTLNDQHALGAAFDLPEGRWFLLEVHQRLGATNAFSEVFVDGVRVTSSTAPNLDAGRSVERIRFGIVAIAAGSQHNALSLRVDEAAVATTGPAAPRDAAAPAPAPEPAPAPAPEPAPAPAPAPEPAPAPSSGTTTKKKTTTRTARAAYTTTKRARAKRSCRRARKQARAAKTRAGKARASARARRVCARARR